MKPAVVDKIFRIWQLSVLKNQDSYAGTHFPDEPKVLCVGVNRMSNRRKRFTFYWIVIILAIAAGDSWGMSRKPPEPAYVPGQVVIKFQNGVTPERAAEIIEGEGCRVEKVLKRTGLHLVKLPEGMDVPEALERFKIYPEVLYVEPDYRVELLEEK